jgi:DNA primase
LVTDEELRRARAFPLLTLLPADARLKKHNRGYMTSCTVPGHEDTTPSMSLCKDGQGNWYFNCFGCGAKGDTVKYVQLTQGKTFQEAVRMLQLEARTAPAREKVAEYDYTDETGKLLYQVVRYRPKDFRVRRPTSTGWDWCLSGLERVLYRLPRVLSSTGTVYYVEGERDVHTMEDQGLVATTHAGGSGSFRPELLDGLRGKRRLVVVPDKDEPGMALMRKVFAAGRERGHDVGFLIIPDTDGVKDVSDWFSKGLSWEELVKNER